MVTPIAPFGAIAPKTTTLAALALILALASPTIAQIQEKKFRPANTPNELPRPDFRFPGNVGWKHLDSDQQFPHHCTVQLDTSRPHYGPQPPFRGYWCDRRSRHRI